MDSEILNEVIELNKCKCEWCDELAKHKEYCDKHYRQLLRHGELRMTRRDPNEIIHYDTHAELILYDNYRKEVARSIIDLEDVERCSNYKWSLGTGGYVISKQKEHTLRLHRFILDVTDDLHVDHINRIRLDNRKSNLRVCTQQENNKNKNQYRSNKTGKRGVQILRGKHVVYLTIDKKRHYIGSFIELNDAIKAREDAEIKFYGKVLEG